MPDRAHVGSLDALEAFRANLIVYLSKARPALEEVTGEMTRMRIWLQQEQRMHWEKEWRRRVKELESAQQALFSARLSGLSEPTDTEQMAVRRARKALDDTEEKLRRVKKWSREFDHTVEPLTRQLDHLLNLLGTQVPEATAYLAQVLKTLSDYAGLAPSAASSNAPLATESPATPKPSDSPGESV
jgi:hypothetical protein